MLSNVKDMASVGIVLAGGRERILVKEGSMRLGPNLIPRSLYYVKEFQTDLMSIGQLMDENKCVGTFHFRSLESAASVRVKENKSLELWHSRMCHPSSRVFS